MIQHYLDADNVGDSKIQAIRELGCDSAAEWFPGICNTSHTPGSENIEEKDVDRA